MHSRRLPGMQRGRHRAVVHREPAVRRPEWDVEGVLDRPSGHTTAAGALNQVLVRLVRRAEASDRTRLMQTFVHTGPLLPMLTSKDHQVLFGRRGAGKTHALSYLAELKNHDREMSLFLDMRQLGSSAGLYTSGSLPLSERGSRLLVDALASVHERLREAALGVGTAEPRDRNGRALPLLDLLADQITRVRVVGSTELQTSSETESGGEQSAGFRVEVRGAGVHASDRSHSRRVAGHVRRTKGVTEHSVHFGAVGKLLTDVLDALDVDRLWLLLDEWSSLPSELQPLLADLLRRCVLPLRNVTVKIAAMEHRTRFAARTDQGDHLGLELGADISAGLDLDDFMVFDNDSDKSQAFFAELLTRHVNAHLDEGQAPMTPREFVMSAFTEQAAFVELVRAAEGVPRDALNIVIVAAERAGDGRICLSDIQLAARVWYSRDKAPAAIANPAAWALLLWIIDQVIGPRRGKAFVLPVRDAQHPLLGALYDARVLHVLRRNVALRGRTGVRYHVYAIDYGCYIDVTTTRQDDGGRITGGANEIAVPVETLRAYRHAVLDMAEFQARQD